MRFFKLKTLFLQIITLIKSRILVLPHCVKLSIKVRVCIDESVLFFRLLFKRKTKLSFNSSRMTKS